MRFGCCTNMFASRPDKTGIEYASFLKASGYDYIELPLAEMMMLSDQQFKEILRSLDTADITCEACNNLFPKDIRLTGPDADFTKIRTYIDKAFDRVSALNARVVVFGSGAAKKVPVGFSKSQAFDQLIQIAGILDVFSEKHGVEIALEPLNSSECNIINTFKEGCGLAESSNTKKIGVLVDYYHMNCEKEDPEILKTKKQWLRHVHFSCPLRSDGGIRRFPTMTDGWSYDDFFKSLKLSGYDARISVEAFSDQPEKDAVDSLVFLKKAFCQ